MDAEIHLFPDHRADSRLVYSRSRAPAKKKYPPGRSSGMKITFNKPYPLLIGLLIILAVNCVVFFKVDYNRTGTPLATISMTERELSLPYWDRFKGENSAVHMNLNWRTL